MFVCVLFVCVLFVCVLFVCVLFVCVLFVCVCECVSLSVVYVYNQSLTAYLHLVALHLYTVDAERGSVCSGSVVVLFDRVVQGSSEGTSQTSPSWRQGRDAGTHTYAQNL